MTEQPYQQSTPSNMGTLTIVTLVSIVAIAVLFSFIPLSKILDRLQAIEHKQAQLLEHDARSGTPTGLEELATNVRAADIVAWRARTTGAALPDLSDYITGLSRELRNDLVADLAYSNLSQAGYAGELRDIGDGLMRLRDRWDVKIEPGSHFYNQPAARLMFIGESFPAPLCADGYTPYVFHLATSPELVIALDGESIGGVTRYRINATMTASGHFAPIAITDSNVLLTNRVLIDAGCAKDEEPADESDDAASN